MTGRAMAGGYTKRAIKRDPSAPLGRPATLYWMDCECGACVPVSPLWPSRGWETVRCDCGRVYDGRGFILARPEVGR